MKKAMISIFIMMIFLSIPVEAKTPQLKFSITYDSQESSYVEVKNEILNIITETIKQVDAESYRVLLSGNLSGLNNKERTVAFKGNCLNFVLGDGKGKSIQGNILNNSFCMVEVKPKSLFRKWFDFFN